jgi:hypothetical protein
LQHGFDLQHGGFQPDALALVLKEIPGQLGVKLRQGVDGLLGFDVGSGHPEKMAAPPSNVLWRLRHNTAPLHIIAVASRTI